MTAITQEFEFRAVVKKVEERFKTVLTDEARAAIAGGAEQPGKIEPDQVSDGWWVLLEDFGVALKFGRLKPHIEPGDTMIISMRKKEKA